MILITIISATSKLFLEDTSFTFNVNTGSTHKMEHLMQLNTQHHRRSSLYTTFFIISQLIIPILITLHIAKNYTSMTAKKLEMCMHLFLK